MGLSSRQCKVVWTVTCVVSLLDPVDCLTFSKRAQATSSTIIALPVRSHLSLTNPNNHRDHRCGFNHARLKGASNDAEVSNDTLSLQVYDDAFPPLEQLRLLMDDDTILVDANLKAHFKATSTQPGYRRFHAALPKLWMLSPKNSTEEQNLDRMILSTAIPSMINLAVVPIVNAVDTFWVGRMGIALALAGQAAANQAFFTIYFFVAFLPTITAPLVAAAIASGDDELAQQRVSEALFLSAVLGGLGTVVLVAFPRTGLGLVLTSDAPALKYAAPYLRWRALSLIPALVSATGFAAYRGMLNTVTPLKISLAINALNVVLDPLFMFKGVCGMGFHGAALATAVAETLSGMVYMRLLLRRKLTNWSILFTLPSWDSLLPLIQGGASMLARQSAINVALVSAARRAQLLDPSGVTAAAYGIVMQFYAVGIVIHVAIQGTAAALVSSAMAKSGTEQARHVADRIFVWGAIVGMLLGLTQYITLPTLVPLFSTLPQVRQAVRQPALIASVLHVINGFVFAGEGTMMGLGCFKQLALCTAAGVGVMVACLRSPLGNTLGGILLSMVAFCSLQAIAMLIFHLKIGPLAAKSQTDSQFWN